MPEQAAGHVVDDTAGRVEASQVNTLADLSPADTLRAAAQVLRDRAADDLAPRWWWDAEQLLLRDANGDAIADDLLYTVAEMRWMATAGPQLAEPLARLLDEEAALLDECTPSHIPTAALAVAHAILGGTP